MFVILLKLWKENIATPSRHIFVFVDEVLIKISVIFPLPPRANRHPNCSKPKHSLEICQHPRPGNISSARSAGNRNKN